MEGRFELMPPEISGGNGLIRPRTTPREDLITAVLYLWPTIGLYLDGWAHHNLANLETFFTPWHAVFYSGYVVSAAWVISLVNRRRSSTLPWRVGTPQGYGLAVIGLAVFGVGGVGDMAWHTVFGVESGLDTLFSPTHLTLLAGALLASLGPFRAAWSSSEKVLGLAPLLSILAAVAALVFFFGFATPFNRDWLAFNGWVLASRLRGAGIDDAQFTLFMVENVQLRAITGFLINAMILLAPTLLILRRWRPPFGAVTLIVTPIAVLNGAIYNFVSWELLIAGFFAGLAGDLLIRLTKGGPGQIGAHRVVGSLLPMSIIGFVFLATGLRHGVGWAPELWSGTLFFVGLGGYAMSYLMLPGPFAQKAPIRDPDTQD